MENNLSWKQNNKQMAFVFRNSKNQKKEKENVTPGPGCYEEQSFKKTITPSCSFVGRCQRNIWNKSQTPGPGEYDTKKSHKVTTCSSNIHNGILVQQSTGASSCFKSKSKRLRDGKPTTPGPGAYEVQKRELKSAEKRVVMSAKPTNLSKYLYNENKRERNHSTIPIQFPFDKKYQVDIECKLNRVSTEQKIIAKQSIFFTSKVQRSYPMQQQISKALGPGSYQIADAYHFIDSKPLHINKEYLENQINIEKKKLKLTTQIYGCQNGQHKNFVHSQNLGPGTYQITPPSLTKHSPSFSKGIQCFGSMESRFGANYYKQNKNSTPGPQNYSTSVNKRNNHNFTKKTVPFNSGAAKKFDHNMASTNYMQKVAPGTYHPQNTFSELLQKNLKKSSVCTFGSTVQRFKNESSPKQRSQRVSIHENNFQVGHHKVKSEKKISKDKICRYVEKTIITKMPEEDNRPLCYDTQSKTISKKFDRKCQINTPFMTGTDRFNEMLKNTEQCMIEQIKRIDEKSIKLITENKAKDRFSKKKSRKKLKSGSAMQSFLKNIKGNQIVRKIEDRLINDKKQSKELGPQTYNPDKLGKSKSFNVLFKPNH